MRSKIFFFLEKNGFLFFNFNLDLFLDLLVVQNLLGGKQSSKTMKLITKTRMRTPKEPIIVDDVR